MNPSDLDLPPWARPNPTGPAGVGYWAECRWCGALSNRDKPIGYCQVTSTVPYETEFYRFCSTLHMDRYQKMMATEAGSRLISLRDAQVKRVIKSFNLPLPLPPGKLQPFKEEKIPMHRNFIAALRDVMSNLNAMDVDDAVGLIACAESMFRVYERLGGEPPTWLRENVKALEDYVRLKLRDALEAQLKEAELEEARLKTVEEKRNDVKAKKARLMEKLGKAPAAEVKE